MIAPADEANASTGQPRGSYGRSALDAYLKEAAPGYEFDPYGEAEQAGMRHVLGLFGRQIAGLKTLEAGDGSESVDGDVLAEFGNIARAAGWTSADGGPVFGVKHAAPPPSEIEKTLAELDASIKGAMLSFTNSYAWSCYELLKEANETSLPAIRAHIEAQAEENAFLRKERAHMGGVAQRVMTERDRVKGIVASLEAENARLREAQN